MNRSNAAAALLAFAASLSGACDDDGAADSGKACTDMGCQSGFVVTLQTAEWNEGEYQVMITADDRTILCAAKLPLPKSYPQSTCSASDVTLGTSGSELPFPQQSLSEVRFSSTYPFKVTILLTRDSIKLAERTFTPEYETLQPNGPGCEPTCTFASESMEW